MVEVSSRWIIGGDGDEGRGTGAAPGVAAASIERYLITEIESLN
jgi:hypothetical protein